MRTERRPSFIIAPLALTLAVALAGPPAAQAGPISDLLAKHRQARQMKLPPVDKPHTIKPYKDPNAHTAGLAQRFKQRFSLKKGQAADPGVIKTSR